MKASLKKEVEELIEKLKGTRWDFNCSTVEEFEKLDFIHLPGGRYKVDLSEDFIRELHGKILIKRENKTEVNWPWICKNYHQVFSEDFIREFQDKVTWRCLSREQRSLKKKFEEEKENQKRKEREEFARKYTVNDAMYYLEI